MKKVALLILLVAAACSPLTGYELGLPDNAASFEDLTVSMIPSMTDAPIATARFYFYPRIGDNLVYGDLQQVEGVWSLTIPNALLPTSEIRWFAEIITDQGAVIRLPEEGETITPLLSDTAPPVFEPLYPEEPVLEEGVAQVVIVRANDDSEIQLLSAIFEGQDVSTVEESDGVIRLIITPLSVADYSKLELSVADEHGNESYFTTEYELRREEVVVDEETGETGPPPFFSARGDLFFDLGLEYTGTGSVASTTPDFSIFTASDHVLDVDFDTGASALLKAGPLELALEMRLQDSRDAVEIIQAVPSALVSDFYDILRLWHPWNFSNEMTFGNEDLRMYTSGNTYFAGITFFEDILTYSFGDQSISFQDKTIKDLGFRGTSASISIPILEVAVGKGLTQQGTYQEDWPQNFLGTQIGLNFFDYFWLQTNISMISDYQGRYSTLGDPGHVSIETLYDLGGINPEQNLVIGVGSGINTPWFSLSGDLGITLYTNDSNDPVEINSMITSLKDAGFIDATTADSIIAQLGILDTIFAIVPLFDYFPPTLGLAASAANQDLWGMLYGGTLSIEPLGLEGWFYKTDSTYKSLGASVSTDLLDIGGAGNWEIGDFGLDISYAFNMNNIPDIITTEILPLFMDMGAGLPVYTDADISNIAHLATGEISTPALGLFGSFGLRYDLEWAMTNAAALGLPASTKNTEAVSHTGSLLWKSGKLELGDFSMSLGGTSTNTFTAYITREGAGSSDSLWEFNYKVKPKISIGKTSIKPAFSHTFGTTAETDTEFKYSLDVSFPLFFIDKMSIDIEVNDEYVGNTGVRETFGIETGVGLKKAFGPVTVNLDIDAEYTDDTDDSKDEIALTWELGGKLEL